MAFRPWRGVKIPSGINRILKTLELVVHHLKLAPDQERVGPVLHTYTPAAAKLRTPRTAAGSRTNR